MPPALGTDFNRTLTTEHWLNIYKASPVFAFVVLLFKTTPIKRAMSGQVGMETFSRDLSVLLRSADGWVLLRYEARRVYNRERKHTGLEFPSLTAMYLFGFCCLIHWFELVALVFLAVPADQTHQPLIALAEEFQFLAVVRTHQLVRLGHRPGSGAFGSAPVPQGLLLCEMLPHSIHHVPEHPVGPQVPHGVRSTAFWTQTEPPAGLGVIADALPAERVVAQ